MLSLRQEEAEADDCCLVWVAYTVIRDRPTVGIPLDSQIAPALHPHRRLEVGPN